MWRLRSGGGRPASAPGTAVLAVSAVVLLAGCEPNVRTYGHVWQMDPSGIGIGVDTRETLRAQVGTPTIEGLAENTPWIYVSEVEELRGVRPSIPLQQLTVVVRFDDDDRVLSVEQLGPEDRVDVVLSERETETLGRRLSIWQQLFGNIGRFDAAQ